VNRQPVRLLESPISGRVLIVLETLRRRRLCYVPFTLTRQTSHLLHCRDLPVERRQVRCNLVLRRTVVRTATSYEYDGRLIMASILSSPEQLARTKMTLDSCLRMRDGVSQYQLIGGLRFDLSLLFWTPSERLQASHSDCIWITLILNSPISIWQSTMVRQMCSTNTFIKVRHSAMGNGEIRPFTESKPLNQLT